MAYRAGVAGAMGAGRSKSEATIRSLAVMLVGLLVGCADMGPQPGLLVTTDCRKPLQACSVVAVHPGVHRQTWVLYWHSAFLVNGMDTVQYSDKEAWKDTVVVDSLRVEYNFTLAAKVLYRQEVWSDGQHGGVEMDYRP